MKAFELSAASPSDPDSWADYECACQSVANGVYDGIGYVFHNTGIVGIDIDAGFDTDGLMTPLCADIVAACRSYTEKSRSGRGVHIYLKGSLPFDGANNGRGVEIYRDRRYFIVTGQVMLFRELVENQEAIDYVVGKYFADMPCNALKCANKELSNQPKIYTAEWRKPKEGLFFCKPRYPTMEKGCRHISMVSLAGSMRSCGYTEGRIYSHLAGVVNREACRPPLPEAEIKSIVRSVCRYERKR